MNNFILNFNSSLESDLHILEFIKKVNQKTTFEFYSSGTTGKPKKITHSYDFLIKNIKIRANFSDDIWALTFDQIK